MAKKTGEKGALHSIAALFDVLGKAKQAFKDLSDHIEKVLAEKMKVLKKGVTFYVVMLLFLLSGLLFLLGGGLLFLSRFMSLDAVLLIGGLACLAISLALAKK